MRQLDVFDRLIMNADTALRTLFIPKQRQAGRENPGLTHAMPILNQEETRHIAGLMRVNHAGEVCAQALYQGQAATAKLTTIKKQMEDAAAEEVDHLAWCEQRLTELNSKPSVLNPLWYSGSFLIGAFAGLAGDRWSLGFVAETERQVAKHLQNHLNNLPKQDTKTHAILTKMHEDEAQHAHTALNAGGAELPSLIKKLMRGISKLLTKSSYYI